MVALKGDFCRLSSHVLELPDSGIREFLACGIRDPRNFSCKIRNPGLWNPEYSSRNPDPNKKWNPESKFH